MHRKGYGFTLFPFHLKAYQLERIRPHWLSGLFYCIYTFEQLSRGVIQGSAQIMATRHHKPVKVEVLLDMAIVSQHF